ncbi:purine/pyrimidine permease, partial [Bacillus altitudinis]|uniref:purine/pyrimidine permease n=1 Tax=Bacillus altitudinis TaxID=293387 RepID=UPI003B519DF8
MHSIPFFIPPSIPLPIPIPQPFQLNQFHSPELIHTTFFSLALVPILHCLSPHILPINQTPPPLCCPLYTLYARITATIFP